MYHHTIIHKVLFIIHKVLGLTTGVVSMLLPVPLKTRAPEGAAPAGAAAALGGGVWSAAEWVTSLPAASA